MQGLKMDSWLAGNGGMGSGCLRGVFFVGGGGDDVLDRSDGHTAL